MRGMCLFCGCTEDRACFDPVSGVTCGWVTADICTFCAECDPLAEFILRARFAHMLALQVPDYAEGRRFEAARRYDAVAPAVYQIGRIEPRLISTEVM